MKQLFLISLLLLACSADHSQNTISVYKLTDGSYIDLASPSTIVLINYWATWCAPCRHEIPELNKLNAQYNQQLIVLGVNYDGPNTDQLQTDMDKLGIKFSNLVQDPRHIWNLGPVNVLPETLIIDANGTLLHQLQGPQTMKSLEDLLKKLTI